MSLVTENRLKLIAKLGSKCKCGSTDVRVFAKKQYENNWMPMTGLYAKKWEKIEAAADRYYLSCSGCWTREVRGVEHGGGSMGVKGCKCNLCRLRRAAYIKERNRLIREDAKLLRLLRKEGKIQL